MESPGGSDMTRHLDYDRIPAKVLTPHNRNLGQVAREAPVYGVSILDKCPNPNCGRDGPMDALMLGPLNLWPNMAVICGDEGCGVHWVMVGVPPRQTRWIPQPESEEE